MKEQTAKIVAAYLRRNTVATSDVPVVIARVSQSLTGLGQPAGDQSDPAAPKPAVPIRRSVTDTAIICLECGVKATMLRRHLRTAHELAPEDYRQRWNLPRDYPLVAPEYATRRSELARAMGLGRSRKSASGE